MIPLTTTTDKYWTDLDGHTVHVDSEDGSNMIIGWHLGDEIRLYVHLVKKYRPQLHRHPMVLGSCIHLESKKVTRN